MRILFALFVALHGAIHLMGFVKAMRIAEIPALRQPIPPRAGWAWLAAAALLLAAAALFLSVPRWWWIPALAGVVVSQILILGAWSDARFGTLANVVILLPMILAMAELRPSSLRSRYERDAALALGSEAGTVAAQSALVTEAELAHLPPAVRRWLMRVGVVGRPRVTSFHARFDGLIRGGPDEPWMSGPVEQYSVLQPVGRLFFMKAFRMGVPAHVYHRYLDGAATMEARLVGVVPLMDVGGEELTRAETVTVLNDLLLFAPGAVPGMPLEWEELDQRRVRVSLENAGHRVSAELEFDDAGDLVGFVSRDRSRSEGGTLRVVPWSTPVLAFGEVNGVRLPVEAEARWLDPGGAWTYVTLTLREVAYNVGAAGGG